jgi:hypothetical protein
MSASTPRARTLTVACNRFRWEAQARRSGERVRSALQLGGVTAVRSRKLRLDAPAAVVSLLAVRWEPAPEPPGGVVVLTLAGGGELRAEVEALEAVLADVSDPWPPAAPRRTTDSSYLRPVSRPAHSGAGRRAGTRPHVALGPRCREAAIRATACLVRVAPARPARPAAVRAQSQALLRPGSPPPAPAGMTRRAITPPPAPRLAGGPAPQG